MELYSKTSYSTLKQIYRDHFTLSHFNVNNQEKMALIMLICYLTDKAKAKKPDTTIWSIIYALNKDIYLPDEILMGLSIVCEDFFESGGEFPTFGLQTKEIVPKVKNILKSYLPF